MEILAILQARYNSTRLPGKVLKPILGKPMLAHQIERIRHSKKIQKTILATSQEHSDDPIAALALQTQTPCYRGSLDDVLDRFYQAALTDRPKHIVRITGDCPLFDSKIADQVIEHHLSSGADYTSNVHPPTFPDGLDIEVMTFEALETAWKEARLKSQREHVTPWIYQTPQRWKTTCLKNTEDQSSLRWTVDTQEDFEVIQAIYSKLYPQKNNFGYLDVLGLMESHPEIFSINQNHQRNEGFQMSLKKDQLAARYQKSMAMLKQACQTIPLGSQTFSKSKTQYPYGVSPYFIQKASGCKVWDVDGNEYTDFINSLCAINLGYNDPDVTKAVTKQLEEGIIFSLPHPIEHLVAEKITEIVPCAEKVRFGKNGSDATAGAVRLARAYTGRDHIAACGYHGWQDWYIGATARNRGVPQATRDLTHTFQFNQIESVHEIFKKYPGQVAAVILEPMNVTEPSPQFLQELKALTHKNGAVLIFDETITGFRFSLGGAQEKFGVTPDLATFGKGIANGYPVSAVAGKAEIMNLMEEIFFSFTFGGETLSLAAALATLNKMQKEPVIPHLYQMGETLMEGTRNLIKKHELQDILNVSGNPTWSFLNFKDSKDYSVWQLKTLFLQEVFSRGVLTLGTHNMSYAHQKSDIQKLHQTYDEVFAILSDTIHSKALDRYLVCPPLEPLFKVR